MRALNSVKRRVFACLGVGSAVAIVLISLSGSALAQQQPAPATGFPVLQVANPSPGGLVLPGDYVISGSAFDPAATQGSGVSHVDVFLGARDQGGLFLGSAVPGVNTMSGITPGSLAAQVSFQLTVSIPSSMTGGQDLVTYAYSASGAETVISTPVYVGAMPTGTVIPVSAQTLHMPGPAGEETAKFSLGNPNTGDVVLNGDYIVSGTASSGFDRITLFLDDRDAGGTALGSAMPTNGTFHILITIPDSANGAHTFTAYAYSSVTGQEMKASVPIFVGAAPTPTPRPS